MRIEHLAPWTEDLQRSSDFYVSCFGAVAGANRARSAWG
jgi:catechol 2,3-dioxygenase-like lactoylglutathione lyase family enzyme